MSEHKNRSFNGMMGQGFSMMERMMEIMGRDGGHQPKSDKNMDSTFEKDNSQSIYSTNEIKSLFEDWVNQVQDEIDTFRKTNPAAGNKEIASYLRISEESLSLFLRDTTTVKNSCCEAESSSDSNPKNEDFEFIKIEKINSACPMCEDYAKEQAEKPIVVMSCEGACLRGDISRRAANLICHQLAPEKTVRLCLGGAFTKDGGQRNLVRYAKKVVALEGCYIKCASRMMKGVVDDMKPEIIVTDQLFDFDESLFGINEMSEKDIQTKSIEVANKIIQNL